MQFTKVFLFAGAVATAIAAPTGALETRGGGLECSKQNGQWQYGWDGAEPSEQYVCQTAGLLNVLNCVSILNGNTINVSLLSILGL